MCISIDNQVFSWGTGSKGRLGHDNNDSDVLKPTLIAGLSSQRINNISAGESHSAAITNTKKLWTWGSNTYGRLGLGMDGNETKQVSIPNFVHFFEDQTKDWPI
jgi:alpha-tubulin suppressor-like RCC1 family protein